MFRLVRAVVLIAILLAGASPGASGHSELFPRELQGESENALFPVDDPWDNLTSDSNSTSENSDSFNESEEDLEPNVSSNSSNASQEDLEVNVISDEEVDAEDGEGFVIPMEWLEKIYDVMAFGSYYLAVFSLACGLVQLPLACFIHQLPEDQMCRCVAHVVYGGYYIIATFFGYILLGYLITIPVYGWPEKGSTGDFFAFPPPPHLGGPDLRYDDRITLFRKTAINTMVLTCLPYLLICLSLLLLGLLVVTIPICMLLSVLLLLCHFSALILRCVETCLVNDMKVAARAAKAACDNKLDFEHLADNHWNTDEFLDSVTSSNVPDWSEAVVNFYAELPTCWCPCWCHFKGKCFVGCLTFVCFDLPYHILIEFPLWFLAIALPSFLKFYLDIFFVLTIFKSLIHGFPSFSFVFPYFNLSFPNIEFDFGFFVFSMPTWLETFFSFCATLAFPSWKGKCGSTKDMGTVFSLVAALVTASTIVTSDLLAFLLDRQSRIQMLEKTYQVRQAKMREAMRKMAEERGVQGLGRFGSFNIKVICLKGRLLITKVLLELASRSSDLGLYVILWVTGQVMNQATLSFALLVARFVEPKDEPYDDDNLTCTLGMWSATKVLHFGIMLLTVLYLLQVLSGKVHQQTIYTLSAWLVMIEGSKVSFGEIRIGSASFIRLTLGQFFLPFLAAGLSYEDWQYLKEYGIYVWPGFQVPQNPYEEALALQKNNVYEKSDEIGTVSDISNRMQTYWRWQHRKKTNSEYAKFYSLHGGFLSDKTKLLVALLHMDKKFGKTRHWKLRKPDGFDFFKHLQYQLDYSKYMSTATPWQRVLHFIQVGMLSPFGIMRSKGADAAAVGSRCNMWQAQLEPVYKATCYSIGQALLLVPFFGALWYTGIKWLSEAPAGLWLKENSAASFSFFMKRRENREKPFVTPSWWCIAAYLVVFARLGVAYFALWGPDFSFLLEIGPMPWSITRLECCALLNTGLYCLQKWLMKQNEKSNFKRVATAVVNEIVAHSQGPRA